MTKTFRFEVTNPNGYPFPIDMLRYDNCTPDTEQDSLKISSTFDAVNASEKIVKVTMRTNDRFVPTIGRWESFGWKISINRIK